MARMTVDLFSDALEVATTVSVVWPQLTEHQVGVAAGRASEGGGPPVLYLLHGRTDDHSAWTRNTTVERHAVAAGMAVVMPSAGRSFYTDEVHGDRYWTYLSQELPAFVEATLQVSSRREDTFVAGLSMGGYGAMKWALREPGRFAAAATMSGALDVAALLAEPERGPELVDRVFGPEVAAENDLFRLLRGADVGALPRLHVSCGTKDHLVDHSRRFVALAEEVGADLTTDFRPGEHEWGFWDAEIRTVLEWIASGRSTLPSGGAGR